MEVEEKRKAGGQKLTDEQVFAKAKALGVIWKKKGPFISTKTKETFICPCGNEIVCTLHDLEHKPYPKCKDCSKVLRKQAHVDKYGCEHHMQRKEIQDKAKETCMERYGGPNPMSNPAVQAKVKETNKERYGTEHLMKLPEISAARVAKQKQTNKEKYGDENPMNVPEIAAARTAKTKATLMERFGADSPMKVPEIAEKAQASREKTFQERYGVNHQMQVPEFAKKQLESLQATFQERYGVNGPMQVPEFVEKMLANAFKKYPYTLPSGKVIQIQGYEYMALDDLFEEGYSEDDIAAGADYTRIPIIDYEYNGTWHKYYPDIYIISENRIIEVKSDFYYKNQKEVNLAKYAGTIAAGHDMDFWIYNRRGNRIDQSTL